MTQLLRTWSRSLNITSACPELNNLIILENTIVKAVETVLLQVSEGLKAVIKL